jgi:hypothetical protein
MQGKKSFVLYTDQREVFDELSDEDAGKLIKHIFAYVNDEDPITEDKLLKVAFLPIKTQLKRDLKIWDEKKSQRAEAGKKGGLAKSSNAKQSLANPSNATNDLANLPVNVNVNVNGNVNDINKDSLISLDEVEVEMGKEKPMHRPYFTRMQEIYNLDEKKVKEAFKNWKILKEGEAMTISKAQNSFNLYLKNNASTGYSESKEVQKPKYAKSTIENNWW